MWQVISELSFVVLTVKLTEIQLDGCKNFAWHAAGHHRSMKRNLRLDCHMRDSLRLPVMYHLILKQVGQNTIVK